MLVRMGLSGMFSGVSWSGLGVLAYAEVEVFDSVFSCALILIDRQLFK